MRHFRAHSVPATPDRRKLDRVPQRYVAARLPSLVQVRAFQIAKVPDVMDRSSTAADFQRAFAGAGQRDALLKQRIENDALPRRLRATRRNSA